MKKFFSRNLDNRGRIARTVLGVSLVIAGLILSRESAWICTALVISGGFVLYEAARGWCIMRACGIRTRI